MNVSKSYVDLLKYVSACSKRSILETFPQGIKKGTELKYYGNVEYKTIPIGMPKVNNSINYDIFENTLLSCGGTRNNALDFWFKCLESKLSSALKPLSKNEENIMKWFTIDNINKIEFFKTLSQKERNYIVEHHKKFIGSSDDMQLFATLSGYKPAWYCESGYHRKVDFSKIKQNPKISNKFDVVKLSKGDLYFINKQEVLKIIEENRDIYCSELRIDTKEGLESIYQKLLEYLPTCNTFRGHTLFGITLGFPRYSSMTFDLSNRLPRGNTDLYDNILLLKEKLLELLHSDKSPFQNYPPKIISKLEKHIETMQSTDLIESSICYCRIYGNEDAAVEKIMKQGNLFDNNFKIEDLM